ncbi:efflux RND transporter periplasmic adaptor subunit [Gayadomonas joobiniege]|uniref:efflux RND transporter periplasmic adaptor subunit n=1 Tax=Gayadomonas joobiniege TaxID=1234606 RepID=UPI000374CC4D|nr:efflux RND transporter periplasmic adaptor subunit [Gayadomonas joobiniege]
MKKTFRTLFLALSVSSLMAACSDGSAQDEQAQQQQRPPQAVDVVELKTEDLVFNQELPGRAVAKAVAQVRPQVSGIITKRHFTEGSQVEAGQTLYQIDDTLYKADVNTAKAQVRSIQVQLENAERDLKRYKNLIQSKAVSQQQLDQTQASVDGFKAQLAVAKAQLESAEKQLEFSKVLAPISGQISKSSVTEGALVSAGQSQVLATITQLNPIYFDAVIPSKTMQDIKSRFKSGELQQSGQKAKLILNDQTVASDGEILFSEVQVSSLADTLTVRAEFANKEQVILPGMFARVSLDFGIRKNSILLPQKAVMFTPTGEASVFTVNNENKVAPKVVQLDRAMGQNWLVKSGLQAGDKVMVTGLQKVQPQMQVNPNVVDLNGQKGQ